MKINRLIEILVEKLPHGASVSIEKDFEYDNVHFVEIDYMDSKKNNCGHLVVKKSSKERKYSLYVSSIKYYPEEKKCTLSGTQILTWIKQLGKEKVFKKIELEDASTFMFPKSDVYVHLTRFRKFIFGKGWYESYGFLPAKNNDLYQKSFLNLQRNSINNVCTLLYFLLRDITTVNIDSKGDVYMTKTYSKYNIVRDRGNVVTVITKNVNRILKNLFNVDSKVAHATVHHILNTIYDYDTFEKLYDIIYKFGVYIRDEEHSELYNVLKVSKPNNTCVLKALTPGNTRKIIDKTLLFEDSAKDTIKYIETLNSLLNIFDHFGVLYVPDDLKFSNRKKTYKKTTERCIKSFDKYKTKPK